jgi:N-acetylmuramoyl-L-alanine amidase
MSVLTPGRIMPRLATSVAWTAWAWLVQMAGAMPLVAIDVGHSSLHPGCISARGVPEFEFNLALARTLRDTLTGQGTPSLLIGADGAMPTLRQRTQAAAVHGASFLLSVHHDSAQLKYFDTWLWQGAERSYSDSFSGYSLFVSRRNPAPDASLRCARAIGSALKLAGMAPTPHHAEAIPGEGREWADPGLGVYYFDDLVVLRAAPTAAVLIEAGVIVNRAEELALATPEMRARIAAAVVQGLADCGATR